MRKKIIAWTATVLGGMVLLMVILYLSTPIGEMIVKGILTGLIFHPQAYSALFPANSSELMLDKIKLPPGFRIEVYAGHIEGARSLALSVKGTVFVGTRAEGAVYAVVDRDKDFRADEVITIAKGLNMPNGVAIRDGALYVAEVSRVLRFDGIDNRLTNPPQPIIIYADFPQATYNGWKFIAFGPDGKLYVPIGAPCNICNRGDPYASITRMDPDGTGFEIFARGIRNTVGFDWHPVTKELWFTDNGRDWLGDDKPPDELNRAVKYEVFAKGWRHEAVTWGRPVDLLVLPDGSLLVSDDKAGAIYRISYHKER